MDSLYLKLDWARVKKDRASLQLIHLTGWPGVCSMYGCAHHLETNCCPAKAKADVHCEKSKPKYIRMSLTRPLSLMLALENAERNENLCITNDMMIHGG